MMLKLKHNHAFAEEEKYLQEDDVKQKPYCDCFRYKV